MNKIKFNDLDNFLKFVVVGSTIVICIYILSFIIGFIVGLGGG